MIDAITQYGQKAPAATAIKTLFHIGYRLSRRLRRKLATATATTINQYARPIPISGRLGVSAGSSSSCT
jgi:hypothetical protein